MKISSLVWLENWSADAGVVAPGNAAALVTDVVPGQVLRVADFFNESTEANDRAHLAALAPRMARVLVGREWAVEGLDYRTCAVCGGEPNHPGHITGCQLDAMLTAIGLPDQASREAVRAEMKRAIST